MIDDLIVQLAEKINVASKALMTAGVGALPGWQSAVETLLARYSLAAMMIGFDRSALKPLEVAAATKDVQVQLKFLDNFRLDIQELGEFKEGWLARAEMYADSIGLPYERGKTRMLPLPALPHDGTSQCLTRCRCKYDIVTLDDTAGDYDAYWRLGATETHCQQCKQRASDWSPIKIRSGELQL